MKIIIKSFPGHAGRPGKRGGSLPRGGSSLQTLTIEDERRIHEQLRARDESWSKNLAARDAYYKMLPYLTDPNFYPTDAHDQILKKIIMAKVKIDEAHISETFATTRNKLYVSWYGWLGEKAKRGHFYLDKTTLATWINKAYGVR